MKKFILPFIVLAFSSFTIADATLTKTERTYAAKEMTNSCDQLVKATKGLSTAQLNYKSSPDSWSIAEVAEHLAISENIIFGMLQATLKTAADPGRRSEVKVTDEKLIDLIADRTNKVKTQEPFKPTGQFGSFEGTMAEFKTKRAEHIKYVKTTEDDLRNRYQQLPFGTIDAYQLLLFMSAHNERHVLQIAEIKADQNYPKK